MNGQVELINKKKITIDDDGPVSKKMARKQQKNQNKSMAINKVKQQYVQKKKQNQQAKGKLNTETLDPKKQRKIDDIKAILQNHRVETIRAVLQKYDYDKQEAMQQLFNTPQDEHSYNKFEQSQTGWQGQNKGQKKPKGVQSKQQEIGSEIINQMYENNEEIDPTQFQQLFAQIANIIKQQQKNIGMDLFEINQFIDNCYLVKNIILNQTEIQIDQNNQLHMQTELFLQELIKNKVALENKRKEDFPTLGLVNTGAQGKGYIQKIQDGYKEEKRKQEYFMPSKVPQVYHPQNQKQQMSIFSINSNPRAYADILQLNKQYNDMGIENLKYIHFRMEGDINLCKAFLAKFYPNKKRQIKIEKVQDKKFGKESYSSPKKVQEKPSRILDQNYKNHSLKQIRDELDHLFKLRSMFRMTKGKTTNIAHRKQLQRLACRDDPKIRNLSQIARIKAIQEMSQQHPQYIDLHGYREQEIDELFNQIEDMIRSEFKKGSSKIETTKLGNNVYCVVRAMTGKGLHSRYNKSVLKPAVLDWCKRNGYKANQTQDTINVYIEVR